MLLATGAVSCTVVPDGCTWCYSMTPVFDFSTHICFLAPLSLGLPPPPHRFPLPLRQQARHQTRLVEPVPTRRVSGPPPTPGADSRRMCAYFNSRHFCCLPVLPWTTSGRRPLNPNRLGTCFLLFEHFVPGWLVWSSGTSAPFTTHLVNDMLRGLQTLGPNTLPHTSNHVSAMANACRSFSAQSV